MYYKLFVLGSDASLVKSNAAQFLCSNNMSISRDYVCDLHKDCPEGEDEEQDCGKCRASFKLSLSILRVQQVKTFVPKQVTNFQGGGGIALLFLQP
jgi:hypothetical protein